MPSRLLRVVQFAREHGERLPARERGAVGHLGHEAVEAEPDAALDLADRRHVDEHRPLRAGRGQEVERVLVVGEADRGAIVGSSRRSSSRTTGTATPPR